MAQITPQGIIGKSLNEYLVDIEGRLLDIDPNWNIAPDSPDGQKNGIDAEALANADEGIVAAYRSKDPASAVGEALNDIGDITGTPRQNATFSVAPITITGTSGSTIPATVSIVRSRIDNTAWAFTSAIVIGIDGTGTGFAACTTPGRVVAAPGELTVIGTPTAGWSSVTNPLAATQGQPEERDEEYRVRRSESVSRPGSNQVDNLLANVRVVPGVTTARVIENNLPAADADGVPGHSVAVIVNGGSDADVGLAIQQKKNPGCGMYPRWNPSTDSWYDPPGSNGVLVNVVSPVTGLEAPITFQRALAKLVFVNVKIHRIGVLPNNIGDLVSDAIIADSSKTLLNNGSVTGFNKNGYDIGEIVPVGRMYTPVNKVLGMYGDSYAEITIGTSASSQGSAPIQTGYNELATFDSANIAVEVLV